MSTNIVTVRHYEDKSISVAINGKLIPDVSSVSVDDAHCVTLKMLCAQYNDLPGDIDEPAFVVKVSVPKRTWIQRFEDWMKSS